jgi:hypothetical protein
LLSLGWPVEHALCADLDQDAAKWTGQQKHMRRALLGLLRELDRAPTENVPHPAEVPS